MLKKGRLHSLYILLFCVFINSYSQSSYQLIEISKKMSEQLIKPAYLKVGDTIAIVATAGIIKNTEPVKKAVKLAESWGLHVILGKNTFNQAHHFAGTDAERLNDLQVALDNKSVKAIWCARGGYGTVRIIDKVDFTAFKQHPKWIIGYSDITVLHSHIHNLGFETLHAMMGMSMNFTPSKNIESIKTLKAALFGKSLNYTIKASKYNKTGTAEGELVGGNLSILQSLLGSNSSLNTENKILFIEEIGEYHYQIDRMIYALKRAGYFNNCNGLIIGGMTKIRKNTTPWGQTIEELILEATKEYNFPILFNFPAGHDVDNRALILGRPIKLNVSKENSTINFIE